MIDYEKLTAELVKPAYAFLGDVDAAAALNSLTAVRVPYESFTPAEFVAAYAPILDQISRETDPVKQHKYDFRDNMLAKMQTVTVAALTALGHFADFIADGYADAALSRLQSLHQLPAQMTAAQFIALLSSRPGTAAEVAGIAPINSAVGHLDVAKARGNG